MVWVTRHGAAPCVARLAAPHPPVAAELLAQVQVLFWESDM
jgi:hypothetical protein